MDFQTQDAGFLSAASVFVFSLFFPFLSRSCFSRLTHQAIPELIYQQPLASFLLFAAVLALLCLLFLQTQPQRSGVCPKIVCLCIQRVNKNPETAAAIITWS